ncbi:MAG: ABC transporter permease [Candidatus Korobacteraceae bacterium]
MHWLSQDLRYALRQLRKSPGFTVVAVLTLALGIGANTAIASAVYALLLRSLPFRDAGQLVLIRETHPQAGIIAPSYQDFLDWRAQSRSFQSLSAYSDAHHTFAQVVIDGVAQPMRAAFASADLFPTLGIQPEIGRAFLPAEDRDNGIHVAVISHGIWVNRFAADPSVVGRAVEVNGQFFTVVGVMPAGRQYPLNTDLWLPLAQLDEGERTSRQYHAADVIGRLRPGITREDAAVELNTIAARLAQTYPVTNRSLGVRVTGLREALIGQLRPTLLTLFGCVALVLFIACANIANLLLVRATHREREIAVRMALGASRARLLRQFLVESLVLSCAGAIAGALLAAAAMPLLTYGLARMGSQPFASMQPIAISLPVLALTALLAIATGAAFSLLPALQAAPDLNEGLRDGQRTATSGRKPLRNLLAAGEMALAVVVLFTAALLLRSLQKLLAVDPGFRTDHLLAVKIDLPNNLYATPQQVERFSMQLQQQVEQIPGVISAAISNAMPLTPSKSLTRFAVEGAPPPAPGNFPVTQLRFVSPSYFRTLGTGLLAGRMFEQKDVDDKVGTFLVNEAFARRYLIARDPVGSRLMMDVTTPHPTAVPVIGVVGDAKDLGVDTETEPVIYTAGYPNGQILLVRTRLDPLALAPAIRPTVASLDRNLGVSDVKTMDGVLSDSLARPRLSAMLLGFFAFLSLGLAAIGVYGVLAFAVTQRTREIGIRMALGAERSQVVMLFLKQGAALVLIGAGFGILGAFAAGRLLSSILFQTAPADSLSAVATLLLLIAVGIAAVCIPAQRASKVDPVEALRAE